jgi:hypothetical protein
MTNKKTEYGTIHYGGPCKDDYGNIEIYDQPKLRIPGCLPRKQSQPVRRPR